MSVKTAINNIKAARKEYEAQLKKVGKAAQKDVAAFLAGALPEGFSIQWDQYTPYFNDGDACTFSVHDPALFRTNDRDSVSYDDDQALMEFTYSVKSYGKHETLEGLVKEALEKLAEAWNAVNDDDFLLSAFGDHTQVVVHSTGKYIVNDSIEHD